MPAIHNVISRGLVALAVAVSGVVSVAAAAPAEAVSSSYLPTYEANVISSINYQRRVHHLKPLTASYCPDKYAESLASRLRYSSSIYHQSMMTVLRGCHATRASENIVRAGQRTSSSTLVALWMKSPGHRANILDGRLTQVGVGTTCSSSRGCTTVATFIRR